MADMPIYSVVYIMSDATTREKLFTHGAPSVSQMVWLAPAGALFLTRWFPTRKAYRVYNLRDGNQRWVKGRMIPIVMRHVVETSDVDAAIMFARLNLHA